MFIIGIGFLLSSFALGQGLKSSHDVMILPLRIAVILGLILPIAGTILAPKKLWLPAIIFFFVLFSSVGDSGGEFGTLSNTWRTTKCGWPTKYLVIHYHKGGNWSWNDEGTEQEWKSYIEREIEISWWRLPINIATSIFGVYLLTLPRKLIYKKNANQKLDPTVKTPVESGEVQGTAGQL